MPHDEAAIREAAALLLLLSTPTRLGIVARLRESEGPVRLAELKEAVRPDTSQASFSNVLKLLVVGGLVVGGREVEGSNYRLADEARGRLEPLFGLIARMPLSPEREPRR